MHIAEQRISEGDYPIPRQIHNPGVVGECGKDPVIRKNIRSEIGHHAENANKRYIIITNFSADF
jgi:hypothetical protein